MESKCLLLSERWNPVQRTLNKYQYSVRLGPTLIGIFSEALFTPQGTGFIDLRI